MILFAESSAILAWLLKEDPKEKVGSILKAAESIVVSELAMVESERTLLRSVATRRLATDQALELRGHLQEAAANWTQLELSPQILERSKRGFPVEPIRSLDALHLATALEARFFVPELLVLSLDRRIRTNAEHLGFEVLPA